MSKASLSPRQMQRIAIGRLLAAAPIIGAIFFLPAGTLRYWEAWIYLAVLFIPLSAFAVYLLRYNPALLERRLKMREVEPEQKRAIALLTVILFGAFLVPGFDRRFEWSSVPAWLVIAADAACLLGYLLFFLTLRKNEYAGRTIEVEQRQSVITTGPYALVRHPMYLAFTLIFGSSPLALGSYWALIPMALFPIGLIPRILNEEQVLHRELEGYTDYSKKVRYRLIPGIW